MDEQESRPAVFPSESELILSILTNYQQQIDDLTKSTEEAISKLKINMEKAQGNIIALAAQKKLLDTLGTDIKKISNK